MDVIYLLTLGEKEHRAEIEAAGPGAYRIVLDGAEFIVSARRTESSIYSMILGAEGGRAFEADVDVQPDSVRVAISGEVFPIGAIDERRKKLRAAAAAGADGGAGEIHSPMPGKVVKVLAPAGTAVKKGQGVIVVEAMKMENQLSSPRDGVVKKVHVTEGQPVVSGALLIELD
jgi:biotin carboxyl carrier protein